MKTSSIQLGLSLQIKSQESFLIFFVWLWIKNHRPSADLRGRSFATWWTWGLGFDIGPPGILKVDPQFLEVDLPWTPFHYIESIWTLALGSESGAVNACHTWTSK